MENVSDIVRGPPFMVLTWVLLARRYWVKVAVTAFWEMGSGKRRLVFEDVVMGIERWPERQVAWPPAEDEMLGLMKPAVSLNGVDVPTPEFAAEVVMRSNWRPREKKKENILNMGKYNPWTGRDFLYHVGYILVQTSRFLLFKEYKIATALARRSLCHND